LKRNDNQGDENVDEEERKHNKVYDVEKGHFHSIARQRAMVGFGRLDRMLQYPVL
jgi:hypothetical protein